MNALRLLTAGVLICVLPAGVRAEKKDYAKLLVGVWEVTKAEKNTVPEGTVIELTNDGKMKVTRKVDGKDNTVEGTYTVDGDKFRFNVKVDGEERKRTITIKKLSEKDMSTVDEQGKSVELTRKK
jgi:uncharacterized protein (TIGR03066 family)